MPTYEYRCKTCGRRFEVEQRITENPLKKCIHCAEPVQRIISAAGIVFKGSGFHVTDYVYNKGKVDASSKPAPTTTTDQGAKPSAKPADSSTKPAAGSPPSSSATASPSSSKPKSEK